MFGLLPMTQYPPTLVTNLFSSQQSRKFVERSMRLHLLLWLFVNGLPVQLDCDPGHLVDEYKLCVGECFTGPANVDPVTCVQKCTNTKATTQKQCDVQKGRTKINSKIYIFSQL